MNRRSLLRLLAVVPAAALAGRAEGAEPRTAADVLADIERLEAEVASRLEAIAAAVPAARPFADSVAAGRARHRRQRERVRAALGLPDAAAVPPAAVDASLDGLHDAQQALVMAHAEGLTSLRSAGAVDVLARHMVDGQRQLTVIDMWRDAESARD